MFLRSTFGILALAGLAVSSSASVLSYRATGTFSDAYGDYESLIGTTFTYDFSYDTEAANIGDEFSASYAMNLAALKTDLGSVSGYGAATIDIDPAYGAMNFIGAVGTEDETTLGYGLFFDDIKPQSGQLPTDLVGLANATPPVFYMTNGSAGNQHLAGFSYAFADKVTVQAVPEPATIAALAVGAVGLLRRRRAA